MTRVASVPTSPRRKTPAKPAKPPKSAKPAKVETDYLSVSKRPLPSLAFLLPLVVLYELGTLLFTRDATTGAETRIIAFNLLQSFLHLFGGTGRFLPAAAVVSILLWWHIAKGDPWRFRPSVVGLMAAESACWAIPLLAIGVFLLHYIPLQTAGGESLAAMIVLSLGAGVYEELVFRLGAFALCSFVLQDCLGAAPRASLITTVALSAVSFSLYHYLGSEIPQWRTFVFRTVAGIFFGILYLRRGFGVTAGAHAAYDVFVHLLNMSRD